MKTLLLLVLSLVVLAACGGDEFSAGRDGLGAAGAPDSGTGGTASAAGAGGTVTAGGTDSGGSTASGGSGSSVAGTGGSTDAGASSGGGAGTGGSDTGGAGGAGGAGGSTAGTGGAPVVFEEQKFSCGSKPKGATCERVVARGSDTTCEVDGKCWCPAGSIFCRDTRLPLDQQLTCQQGTTCAQPKEALRLSCTNDNQCLGAALCAESKGTCFCPNTAQVVCRDAQGMLVCAAPGTCPY